MERRLLLFAKSPLPGLAKTRLAQSIGAQNTAIIAEALTQDSIALCEKVAAHAGAVPVLCYTGPISRFAPLVTSEWRVRQQRGGDIGQRIENALVDCEVCERNATVIVGTDSPHCPGEHVISAFAMLEEVKTVLGPVEDGGYYLLGVRGSITPGTLSKVRWSTEHTLADTLAAFKEQAFTCGLLPGSYDIDELSDLQRVLAELEQMPRDWLPALRQAMQSIDLPSDA